MGAIMAGGARCAVVDRIPDSRTPDGTATVEPFLEGERVRLRPWTLADVAALTAACQDPEIPRWTRVPSPYAEHDARWFVEHFVPMTRDAGGASFCLEPRDATPGSEVAGSIALLSLADGVGEIGYWTTRRFRGRGLTRDAVAVLTRWCFTARDAARLELHVEPGNAPSRGVAESAGYVAEGVMRDKLSVRGGHRDLVMYARLRRDP